MSCFRILDRVSWIMFALLWATVPCGVAAPIDFAHDIVPVLRKHCVACHGGAEAKGGFSLNHREQVLESEAVDIGEPAKSQLLLRIHSTDPEEQMPPHDRPRPSPGEVALLDRWVHEGLVWEEGYSFASPTYEPQLLPRRPTLPPVIDGRDHPIDRIVDAYWLEHPGARPAPLADRQFLRRVYLDVLGLLPPSKRVEAFVSDASPDKRSKLIDELLNQNDDYAVHWITFWNDLLRNAYSGTGFIDGGRKQLTEWLYRALYSNLPYDEFVRQLIVPTPDSEGFVKGIKWRGNVNASQIREIQFAQNLSQVFLGINMKCASCHDSFIDRWTLRDTYGLAATISSEPLEIHRCDKAQGTHAVASWIFPELGAIDSQSPQPARMRQLALLMTHPQNGRLTRTMANRLWHRLMGRGIVHPVDAMHTQPWSADLLDYLAISLADASYDLKQMLRLILNSRTYQSQAMASAADPEAGEYRFAGPVARRLTAEQFVDAVRTVTGVWPTPEAAMFQRDGRDQHGQLRDVLIAVSDSRVAVAATSAEELLARWGARPIRAGLTGLDSLQAQLGRPAREQVVSSRPTQLTTLQAITFSNGEALAGLLRQGAEGLSGQLAAGTSEPAAASSPPPPAPPPLARPAMVDFVYRSLLSRPPTEEELATMVAPDGGTDGKSDANSMSVTEIEDLLWTVLMLPEFQVLR